MKQEANTMIIGSGYKTFVRESYDEVLRRRDGIHAGARFDGTLTELTTAQGTRIKIQLASAVCIEEIVNGTVAMDR